MNTISLDHNLSGEFLFCTGGMRSGKSSFAQSWLEDRSSLRYYLAPLEVRDKETEKRVLLHQKARKDGWLTYELKMNDAFDLQLVLEKIMMENTSILFDCLGTWVGACMSELGFSCEITPLNEGILLENLDKIESRICSILQNSLTSIRGYIEKGHSVAIVSNEVGNSLISQDPLSRAYVDILGRVNQLVAKSSTSAYLVASGLPLQLK